MSNEGTMRDGRPKRRGRPRPLPAHVMARNLAIEKKRRGEMNENFLDLARLLPALAFTRRLTKVLIVNQSIEHLRQQRNMCISAARDMQELLVQNRQLITEVNALRKAAPPIQAMPVTDAMEQLAGVENQVLGTFPAGFGDNWTGSSPQAEGVASETLQEFHDMTLTSAIISPGNGALDGEEHIPSIPVSGYHQPQGTLNSSLGISNDPSFFPHSELYTTTHPTLNNQLLAHMPDMADLAPDLWVEGIDMGYDAGLLQHGYGDTWGLS